MQDNVNKTDKERTLATSTNQVDDSPVREKSYRISKASYLFIVTVFTTFLAEIAVMFFLSTLPALSVHVEAIIDALLLSVLVFPILYFLFFKALVKQIKESLRSAYVSRQSEQKYRLLMESANDAIFIADADTGMLVDANQSAQQMIGCSLDEIRRMRQSELHPPDEQKRYMKIFKDPIIEGQGVIKDLHVVNRKGNLVPIEISASVIKIGEKSLIQGVFRDITERKRAEEKLLKEHELIDAMNNIQSRFIADAPPEEVFESILNEILYLTQSKYGLIGEIFYTTEERPFLKTHAITNIARNEETRKFYDDYIKNGLELNNVNTLFGKVISNGEPVIANDPANDSCGGGLPDGHPPINSFLGIPLYQGNQMVGIVGIANRPGGYDKNLLDYLEPYLTTSANIIKAYRGEVQRKKAEENLQASREKFAKAFQSSPDSISISDMRTGLLIEVNDGFERITGYKHDEVTGKTVAELNIWENSVDRKLLVEKIKISGSIREFEFEINTKGGDIRTCLMSAEIINLNGKSCMLAITRDITDRKRAEEALRESEERFRMLVENQGEGVVILDPDENFTFANPAAYSIFGSKDGKLIGRNLREFLNNNQVRVITNQTALRLKNMTSSHEMEFIRKDGEKRFLHVTATPLLENDGSVKNILGVFRDITENRRVEDELAKKEKLESIGLLAGGIAHDFNNFLTAILGNISMIKGNFSEVEDSYRILEDAEKATLQAQNLTRQLLTFSKGGIPVKEILPIAETLLETIRFTLSGSNVRFEYELPDDLKPVKFDKGQIGQVFQNIIINANQAMPNGGIIRLSAENIVIDENYTLALSAGGYVKIRVKDNGPGISEENRKRIFDPFFTTKETGSGLGLTTAYSIIKKHDGFIDVDSSPGSGTTFTIYLPATEEIPVPQIRESRSVYTGFGRILVVDDEKFIRDMLERMLTKSGYDVSCAPEGSIAVEMYKNSLKSESPFDLVVVDLTIPGGMGGKDIIIKLREINPEVKAIVSSGYSNDPIMADFENYGFVGRIAKPHKTNELYRVIQNVLDDSRPDEKNRNIMLTP